MVLTHEAVALWETAFEAAHNGVNVKKEEIGTDSETNEDAVPATLVAIDEAIAHISKT